MNSKLVGQIKRKLTCFSARRVVGACKCHVTELFWSSTNTITRWWILLSVTEWALMFLIQVYVYVQGKDNTPWYYSKNAKL